MSCHSGVIQFLFVLCHPDLKNIYLCMITLQICFYDCWYMTELIIPVFLPCHDGPG